MRPIPVPEEVKDAHPEATLKVISAPDGELTDPEFPPIEVLWDEEADIYISFWVGDDWDVVPPPQCAVVCVTSIGEPLFMRLMVGHLSLDNPGHEHYHPGDLN